MYRDRIACVINDSGTGEIQLVVADLLVGFRCGEELFGWLQDGAHLYVCGDEKLMAKDVDGRCTTSWPVAVGWMRPRPTATSTT